MEVKLLHRKKQDQVYSFKFSISGQVSLFQPCDPLKWPASNFSSHYHVMHSYLTSVWLLTALGPDHMAVYVSPASDVDLLTSSLGPLLPIQDGGDRVVYFIYYSHGTDVGPWELSLELLVSRTITVLIILVITNQTPALQSSDFVSFWNVPEHFVYMYIKTHLCGSWGSYCCQSNDCIESYTKRVSRSLL